MNVLSIDIGGTGVKFLVTGETERCRFIQLYGTPDAKQALEDGKMAGFKTHDEHKAVNSARFESALSE